MPDGLRWFELSVSAQSHPGERAHRFTVLARDITNRRAADDDLRINELKYRTFFELSADAIYIIDTSGRILPSTRQPVKSWDTPRRNSWLSCAT